MGVFPSPAASPCGLLFCVCAPPAARARGPALLQPQASLDLNPCSPPRMVGSKGRARGREGRRARARVLERTAAARPPSLRFLALRLAGPARPLRGEPWPPRPIAFPSLLSAPTPHYSQVHIPSPHADRQFHVPPLVRNVARGEGPGKGGGRPRRQGRRGGARLEYAAPAPVETRPPRRVADAGHVRARAGGGRVEACGQEEEGGGGPGPPAWAVVHRARVLSFFFGRAGERKMRDEVFMPHSRPAALHTPPARAHHGQLRPPPLHRPGRPRPTTPLPGHPLRLPLRRRRLGRESFGGARGKGERSTRGFFLPGAAAAVERDMPPRQRGGRRPPPRPAMPTMQEVVRQSRQCGEAHGISIPWPLSRARARAPPPPSPFFFFSRPSPRPMPTPPPPTPPPCTRRPPRRRRRLRRRQPRPTRGMTRTLSCTASR